MSARSLYSAALARYCLAVHIDRKPRSRRPLAAARVLGFAATSFDKSFGRAGFRIIATSLARIALRRAGKASRVDARSRQQAPTRMLLEPMDPDLSRPRKVDIPREGSLLRGHAKVRDCARLVSRAR
jgi:hypothetical protein